MQQIKAVTENDQATHLPPSLKPQTAQTRLGNKTAVAIKHAHNSKYALTVEKKPCTSIFYAVNIKEKKYAPDKSINPLKIDDYVYLRYHISSTIQHSIGDESAITKKQRTNSNGSSCRALWITSKTLNESPFFI